MEGEEDGRFVCVCVCVCVCLFVCMYTSWRGEEGEEETDRILS
jgi:hypothetical protein